jgi:hypothetical protein
MLRSVSSLAAMLALVAGASAQDTGRIQRDIDALSSPPLAEEIRSLGENSPNAYVLFMQDYLKNIGSYAGPLNGQLTNATIRAIVDYCREARFGETCIRGPLLPESIAAVSEAVAAALAPAVAEDPIVTAATPVAEAPVTPEAQPVAVAVMPALPEGWRLNDNGGRGSLGLVVDLVSAGPAEAVIRFSGTAAQSGYFNVELAPMQPALPGTWVASVEASVLRAADTGGKAWLRTAILSDAAYLGELFPGVPLEDAAVTHTGSGVPGDEVTRLMPYVQLWAEADEVIDVTITLSNPVFGRQ